MAKKVNIKEVARRYVTALFELSESAKNLDKTLAELKKVLEVYDSVKMFNEVANSPLIDVDGKVKAAELVSDKLKLSAVSKNFLKVVAQNKRLDLLPNMVAEFEKQIDSANGVVQAKVISAEKLTSAQADNLSKQVAKKTGKKVKLEEAVDESLIGGFKVEVGSEIIDFSVKNKLAKVQQNLKQAS